MNHQQKYQENKDLNNKYFPTNIIDKQKSVKEPVRTQLVKQWPKIKLDLDHHESMGSITFSKTYESIDTNTYIILQPPSVKKEQECDKNLQTVEKKVYYFK